MRIGVCVTSDGLWGAAVDEASAGSPIEGRKSAPKAASTAHAQTSARSLGRAFEALMRTLGFEPVKGGRPHAITSITFDLGSLLEVPQHAAPISLRVAPRPPVDAVHELDLHFVRSSQVHHIAGGISSEGDPLVPLDIDAVATISAQSTPGSPFVVTGVGSLIDPTQERQAGEVLTAHGSPAHVEFSHRFSSSSFAIRERTALVNSSLVPEAEHVVTPLAIAAAKYVAEGRVYVASNSGGCHPLPRWSIDPVHSMFSGPATKFIGAAALAGVATGGLLVSEPDGAYFAKIEQGVPTAVAQYRDTEGYDLATPTAGIIPVRVLNARTTIEARCVIVNGHQPPACTDKDPLAIESIELLRAVGAAHAPLSVWVTQMVRIKNVDDMQRAVAAARAEANARLVSYGADSVSVMVLEARVVATAYEHPGFVSVRVHAVASPGTALLSQEVLNASR